MAVDGAVAVESECSARIKKGSTKPGFSIHKWQRKRHSNSLLVHHTDHLSTRFSFSSKHILYNFLGFFLLQRWSALSPKARWEKAWDQSDSKRCSDSRGRPQTPNTVYVKNSRIAATVINCQYFPMSIQGLEDLLLWGDMEILTAASAVSSAKRQYNRSVTE